MLSDCVDAIVLKQSLRRGTLLCLREAPSIDKKCHDPTWELPDTLYTSAFQMAQIGINDFCSFPCGGSPSCLSECCQCVYYPFWRALPDVLCPVTLEAICIEGSVC